jgi:DNA polymerase I-like protein with 3'-5' exonuclease and polymerase domains
MRLIGFDTETFDQPKEWALQPWRAAGGLAGITCFAHAWVTPEGTNKTLSVWSYDQPHVARLELERFLTYCAREQAHIVCWNAPFDIAWCLAYGLHDQVYANKWIDGSLIIRRIKNAPVTPTCGLKAVVAEYLPQFAGYEEGVSFDPEDQGQRDRLMKYCELDAAFARALTQKFLAQLTPAERRNAIIEAACLPMVAEANLRGLEVDEAHLATRDAHLDVTAKTAHAELLATDPAIGEMNLNSPDQVRKSLFERWDLPG